MGKRATVHRLELVPPQRTRETGRQPQQVVDVTLRTSDQVLLTVEQAGERLGVSRSTMYRLIAAGDIDVVHVRALTRVEPEELRSYVMRLGQTRGPHHSG
jgi:excisionase family DNA binding protein